MFKKIALNTLASSVARVIGGILALISLGFITRALGVHGFGQYATGVAYLSTFQIMADLGLYSLLTKEISQKPDQEKELVSQFFTLRLIVATFFLFIASVLVFLFPYSQELKIAIVFASAAFIMASLTQLLMGIFQKYLQVYKAAFAEVVGRIVQLGLVWIFFVAGGGLFHFVGAIVAGIVVVFVLDLIFARRLVPFGLTFHNLQWRKIIKKTYPIAISIIFTLLYFRADTLMLSVMKTQEDVGIYNVAYKVLETLIFFPAAFIGLLLPVLSKYAMQNRDKFLRLLSGLSDLMVVLVLPTVVAGILLAPSIVNLIGGIDFSASAPPLRILFLAIGVIFFGTLFGSSVIALNLQRKAMWAYIIGFGFNFIANLVFIPEYSYIGASWTTLATEILVTGYIIWVVRSRIKFKVSIPIFFRSFLATSILGLFLLYVVGDVYAPLSAMKFFWVTIFGFGIFIVSAYLFKLHKSFSKKLFLN